MDQKKVIEKLIKIAQTQQKIIERLAQDGTRQVDFEVPDQPTHPGPSAAPAHKLPMPTPTHASAEAAVKAKMGPDADKVGKLYFTTANLAKGAAFKVQYAPAGAVVDKAHLAKAIENAVSSAQETGNPSVPKGTFYVEQWHNAGVKVPV